MQNYEYVKDLTTFCGDYVVNEDNQVSLKTFVGEGKDTRTIEDPAVRGRIESKIAVHAAYQQYINEVADRLAGGASVLCICDKMLSLDLAAWIQEHPHLKHRFEFRLVQTGGAIGDEIGIRQLTNDLFHRLRESPTGLPVIVVVKHMDLMMSTAFQGQIGESAANILYWMSELRHVSLLAFADPELPLPKVLENAFAEKKVLPFIQRDELYRLLRPEEAMRISMDSLKIADQLRLYQYVSGRNAIQVRELMRYVGRFDKPQDQNELDRNYDAIRRMTAVSDLQIPAVHDRDIVGYEQTKNELRKRVFLGMQKRATAVSQEDLERADWLVPKGVILYGPPRNGKTEMAKWLANTLNAPLLVIRGPEIKNMYHGETERAIRHVFAQARKAAPSVILIDEIDSLTSRREGTSSEVGVSMVSMFLTEMDGLDKTQDVLIIGTTNRLDAVDPAFKAPGRFGVLIEVGYPTLEDRIEILKLYRDRMQLEELTDPDIEFLAELTEGELDWKQSQDRMQLRNAVYETYPRDFQLTAGPALDGYLDARFEIGDGPRWSCDLLRGICQNILIEAEWYRSQNTPLFIGDKSFLASVVESTRAAYLRNRRQAIDLRGSLLQGY